MKDLQMLHGALNLVNVNAGLKPDEKALIVCDTDNIDIAKALAYAVKRVGAEYSICIMEPRSTQGEEPTDFHFHIPMQELRLMKMEQDL